MPGSVDHTRYAHFVRWRHDDGSSLRVVPFPGTVLGNHLQAEPAADGRRNRLHAGDGTLSESLASTTSHGRRSLVRTKSSSRFSLRSTRRFPKSGWPSTRAIARARDLEDVADVVQSGANPESPDMPVLDRTKTGLATGQVHSTAMSSG
jgi:hypothetical protein